MKISIFAKLTSFTFLVISFVSLVQMGSAQSYDRIEKGRMKDMLKIVKSEIKKNYYDTNFHGIDLEARFKKAEERLDQVTSTGQGLAVIAQLVMDFNDSHLYFIPPSTTLAVEYGWRMQAFGDKVFVTQVRPDSDAAAKGLKPGDQILSVSGFKPSRKELWKVLYYYNAISKRDKLNLSVLSPGQEAPRDLEIKAKLKQTPKSITFTGYWMFDDFYDEENYKHRFVNVGDITIWKMPSFSFDPAQVDELVGRVRKGGSLLLDLRGNGGGYVVTMERLTGSFFDRDIKVAELKGRKPMKPSIAKSRGNSVFKGQLIVLVDSGSGSASEIFARVVQLEKRGSVLGDVSAGAVMQSISHDQEMGTDSIVPFSISITDADVIMSDGKSLEHTGVVPDEVIVPSGADLLAGRDPVMARAVEILGGKLSPEEAGKFFKYYWKKN